MAQTEAMSSMGFDGISGHGEDADEKSQTQKFIKIITTFASKVDVSVSKAQNTMDILLAQFNLPLSPKEAVEDNTSKIKSVMAVIRRAAILQRDVDRLGQILIHNGGGVTVAAAPASEDQLGLFDTDSLLSLNDYLPPKQNEFLPPKPTEFSIAKLNDFSASSKQDENIQPKHNAPLLPKLDSPRKQDLQLPPKRNENLPPAPDCFQSTQNDNSPPKREDYLSQKQDDYPSPRNNNLLPLKQDEQFSSPEPSTDLPPSQDDNLLPEQNNGISPLQPPHDSSTQVNDPPPKSDWVAIKAPISSSAFHKLERPLPHKPERPPGPKPERALSPPPEHPQGPKPERPLGPKPERSLSPKTERPLSPKLERALSPSRSLSPRREIPPTPKKEIAPPPPVSRVRSPSPNKNIAKPPANNVSNLKAMFRDLQQVPPSSPKTANVMRQPPVNPVPAQQQQQQPKANSSLLAKSLSTSVISNNPGVVGGLTKQPSLSGIAPVSKTPPKQYAAPPPPSSSAGSFSSTPPSASTSPIGTPPSHISSTPPSNFAASSPPVKAAAAPFKKAAAPALGRSQLTQSSPSLMTDRNQGDSTPARAIPLSPRTESPTPPPPSLPANSAAAGSFLSSTPPPSMVKTVLKGAPLKKAPVPVSASPPSAASSPPVNGAFGPTSPPKRPARSTSNSPHPIPLHTSFELGSSPSHSPAGSAIDISPTSTSNDDPIPLSSSTSNGELLTDDSGQPYDTPTDDSDPTSSFYSQSNTPPSTLNIIPTEITDNSENIETSFTPVPLDEPSPPTSKPEYLEPPVNNHAPIADDLNDLELEEEDEVEEEKPKEKVEKFDSVKIKKDINALLDEIDREEAMPQKKVNPGIKDMLSPFFNKRPKNKQEMETNLKDKGIVPREDRKKKDKH